MSSTLEYGRIFAGDEKWQSMPAPTGTLFDWDTKSTYVREPPYFSNFQAHRLPSQTSRRQKYSHCWATRSQPITFRLQAASPSILRQDNIFLSTPCTLAEFNSFGSRRGNHEVMMRGTFGNIRLHNLMVPGKEGPWTRHVPSGETMSIYDAAMRYQQESTPLVVIAGKEYGSGSSRDWAAKGLAHCSALRQSLPNRMSGSIAAISSAWGSSLCNSLSGRVGRISRFDGFRDHFHLRNRWRHHSAAKGSGDRIARRRPAVEFETMVRIDAPAEVEYFRNGGILPMVLRQLLVGIG